MNAADVNSFYRELDTAERSGHAAADLAADYAYAALLAPWDYPRVLARVAGRFAIRELLARERMARQGTPIRARGGVQW